jgi:glycosyltransferase involved in cell wall biosynthesis
MRDVRPFSIPERISCDAISIVIPVKNNQEGIDRFLSSMVASVDAKEYPKEIVIVDNGSDRMTSVRVECPFPVRVLSCTKTGPGAARNVGVSGSTGAWILFTDSDCVATPSLVSGYAGEGIAAIGFAGRVDTPIVDQCSRYYVEQKVFLPVPLATDFGVIPATLVTANCLVLRDAFLAVGGFDERFVYAGGEDTDLGFRLRMVGDLRYNLNSVAAHHVEGGLPSFVERFIRYGRAHRLLEERYENIGPVAKPPASLQDRTQANEFLAGVLHHSMWWGYMAERSPELLALPATPPHPTAVPPARPRSPRNAEGAD